MKRSAACRFARLKNWAPASVALACGLSVAAPAPGQDFGPLPTPSAAAQEKESKLIGEVLEPELTLQVEQSRSKIIRTKLPISRIAITDPTMVEVNEFDPNEIEVIGLKAGETTLSIWFTEINGQVTVLRYLVQVGPSSAEQGRADIEYGNLQRRINELFPNSQVQLIPVADKLVVRGQARDSKEAAEILALVAGQSVNQQGSQTSNFVNVGTALQIPGAEDLKTTSVVNLLHVPGEHQVMLKVRIAELSRGAARELGLNANVLEDSLSIATSFTGGASNVSAIIDAGDLELFLRAFSTNGYGKILAEPTLVAISGQPATFLSGGEFAVPTAVGIDGIGAASTTFRGFGTQLNFTPTVIDKDRIRLSVSPSFSTLNQDNAVDGIPGLDVRSVSTTVDLREGQWLAIAGLIQDEQTGTRSRLPFLGDIPVVGAAVGNQRVTRDETELVVLVSPELVHPMEPEQVPLLLPGMDVTDPTDAAFFLLQMTEGCQDVHYRSTVWPAMQQQMTVDHFHAVHAERRALKGTVRHRTQHRHYVSGPQGFSH